jgi:putative serine protease PepD
MALLLGLVGGVIGTLIANDTDDGDDSTAQGPEITSSGPVAGGRGASPVISVADKVLPSVVSIEVRGGAEEVSGSGFVYDDEGRIVTNNHVIEPAAKQGEIRVSLPDGSQRRATIVGRSPSYDLAVIELANTKGLVAATLGKSNRVRVGQTVVAIGSPLGLNATVTSGIISATHRPVTAGGEGETSYINALQTDAAINPGNSGGPLADLDGFVIGVNSAIATLGANEDGAAGSIGVGFSIPIDQVSRTVEDIIETGEAHYPVIGAEVSVLQGTSGARIQKVAKGSPAARAGLREGDVVTAIDDLAVADGVQLIVAIRSYEPGDRVSLTVKHGNGRSETVTLTLDQATG